MTARTRESRTTVETLTATMRMTMKVVLARESVSTMVSSRAKVPTLLQWHWVWLALVKTAWQWRPDQASLALSQSTQLGELTVSLERQEEKYSEEHRLTQEKLSLITEKVQETSQIICGAASSSKVGNCLETSQPRPSRHFYHLLFSDFQGGRKSGCS